MHKLDRDPIAPAGLTNYRHGLHRWDRENPTEIERQNIWKKLDAMQGNRCTYCEALLVAERRHIEHFRQRSRYPQGTFDWRNLFGSCNRPGTCGDKKDKCGAYNHVDLIKPDTDDPEKYFVFDSEGGISPRDNLSGGDEHRALETIRILNLNEALRQIRYSEIQGYKETAEYFAALAAQFPIEDWLPLLQEELLQISALPFATAIRHILTPQQRQT